VRRRSFLAASLAPVLAPPVRGRAASAPGVRVGLERVALEYAERMTRTGEKVDDALFGRLRALGVHAVVYHRAYVSDDALSTQVPGDYEATFSSGYLATARPGVPYVFGSNGGAPATLLDFTVTRQPQATFRAVPGTQRLRPGPQTALPGLYLAGAWTDTGWPATMEGAVRSGITAARRALAGRA